MDDRGGSTAGSFTTTANRKRFRMGRQRSNKCPLSERTEKRGGWENVCWILPETGTRVPRREPYVKYPPAKRQRQTVWRLSRRPAKGRVIVKHPAKCDGKRLGASRCETNPRANCACMYDKPRVPLHPTPDKHRDGRNQEHVLGPGWHKKNKRGVAGKKIWATNRTNLPFVSSTEKKGVVRPEKGSGVLRIRNID